MPEKFCYQNFYENWLDNSESLYHYDIFKDLRSEFQQRETVNTQNGIRNNLHVTPSENLNTSNQNSDSQNQEIESKIFHSHLLKRYENGYWGFVYTGSYIEKADGTIINLN